MTFSVTHLFSVNKHHFFFNLYIYKKEHFPFLCVQKVREKGTRIDMQYFSTATKRKQGFTYRTTTLFFFLKLTVTSDTSKVYKETANRNKPEVENWLSTEHKNQSCCDYLFCNEPQSTELHRYTERKASFNIKVNYLDNNILQVPYFEKN